jgi:phosphatidylglycerol:prolipoprotein diacylglycerol transferase
MVLVGVQDKASIRVAKSRLPSLGPGSYNQPVMQHLLTFVLLIAYPDIKPELFSIAPFDLGWFTVGPFAIRWYALAYIAGLIVGWRYLIAMSRRPNAKVATQDADDFLLWATLGVVLGGRLGYVLFYEPSKFLGHPLQILYVWQGGMASHGGFIGVTAALLLFARQRKLNVFNLSDLVAQIAPIGLFFGRIANFVNGELWGRGPTDVPWAMIFPKDQEQLPRHPSQLYEAGLEGVALFASLWLVNRYVPAAKKPGFITGCFLAGYAIARITAEFFRQPDSFLPKLIGGATMGQLLSLPVLAAGAGLAWYAARPSKPAAR